MFSYSLNLQDIDIDDTDYFIAKMPGGIASVDYLFSELVKNLLLPDYFGDNWNALSDCLQDFHWIPNHKIIILHEDLPTIPQEDLFLYLDVLRDAVEDWNDDDEHSLEVVFPEHSKSKVESILNQY